ncbi:MAG: hypothetical protein Q9160_001322 [Pyrenula sp. 1 TL-2023]
MAWTHQSLDRIISELKSKHEETKIKAANDLRENVVLYSRELAPEKFVEYYNSVSSKIASLIVTSADNNEKLGGLLALDRLIDFDGVDAAQKTTRFASYLRNAMRSSDPIILTTAACSLGRLAKPGGALTAELVESEIQSALEWLQLDRQDSRRFAAVLVIRELARNSPTLLYGFIPQIFELIWVPIRDPRVMVRETAAEAVSACLEIIAARDEKVKQQWFPRIYETCHSGLRSNSLDAIHGSLLIMRELLQKGAMFMQEYYRTTCELILGLKDHKDPKIRAQVVQTIPVLAEYTPLEFISNYLHKFMIYLQAQLKREKDRNAAFIAIGRIAKAVGSAVAQYLDGILLYIRDSLSAKTKNRAAVNERPMFECISMLASAVGQTLSKYMDALLDPIFACGLSESLVQALVDMAHYIPPMKLAVQERLLDLLSLVLCGSPYRPLGCPDNHAPSIPAFAKDYGPLPAEYKDSEIALALHTLGTFDFKGHVLNEFVRDVAIRYVDNENPEIRKAAALTCCQLFVSDPIVHQTSNHSIQVVSEVIDKLLTVGVGDPDPEIRRTILNSLDKKFDQRLAKPDNIRCLILAVNDEVFMVREAAICILGRIANVNPAYVFPPLRKLLVNLLTGLVYSTAPRQKEETAHLIGLFVSNATKLIRGFCEPMINAVLPKTRDSNAAVASTSIRALGEMSTVAGEHMQRHIPSLMPIILEALQDLGSHTKREAAIATLGQLAVNCGYVIDPYIEHPQLLTTLINIIKSESQEKLRKDAIKLIGVLGALDPYRFQQISETTPEHRSQAEVEAVSDVALIMKGLTPSNDEYYPTVVINTLLNSILRDHSLVQYHSAVIDAIVTIFKTLGLKCVTFLEQIIPAFLIVIRGAPVNRLDSYFNQMAILVSIVGPHIRAHLPEVMVAIKEFWNTSSAVQATIVSLIESISKALSGEFKLYLAEVLPLMLGVLENDNSSRRQPSERVMHAFLVFGHNAEEYMHLVVPTIVHIIENNAAPPTIRKTAIDTLGKLSRQVNVSDYSSLMIHPLAKVIRDSSDTTGLNQTALDCVCVLIFQLGHDFMYYVPLMTKSAQLGKVSSHTFDLLIGKLQKGESIPQDLNPEARYGGFNNESALAEPVTKKIAVNQIHLRSAWDASQKTTKEDWQEWMRRLSVELLRESPSHALRACASLAGIYQPLAKDLFNSAFVSCWTELFDQYQEELVKSIEEAIKSPQVPPEILHILLNLAEFMEHDDKALPIDIRVLGRYAGKCHAWAKALHYKELEFEQEQSSANVEALISINNNLQQSDAAIGILRKAQGYDDVQVKEAWFEKLQRWEEALEHYRKKAQIISPNEPGAFEVQMGKMRCLHALGEWKMLADVAQEQWANANSEHRNMMAALAAAAAWGRGQWELMDSYLSVMKERSADRSFFGAILCIHRNQFEDAGVHITRARNGLNNDLSAVIGESYNRAYDVVVRIQMLAELEEIIDYKKSNEDKEKQAMLRATWTKRIQGCQQNVEVWQRMLKVRNLVVNSDDNLDMWIKFANLCRKSGRVGLAERSLASLEQFVANSEGLNQPELSYARLKYQWSTSNPHYALDRLRDFTRRLENKFANFKSSASYMTNGHSQLNGMVGMDEGSTFRDEKARTDQIARYNRLLAKCYLKQGDWQAALQHGDWKSEQVLDGVSDILASYQAATHYNNGSYKAWHSWALANFEVVNARSTQSDRDSALVPDKDIADHVVPAVKGFFKSISLSTTSSLQDTLRLLTLWFAHGANHDVNQLVTEGLSSVTIDTWLEVIPQLIARINKPNMKVRQAVHRLLAEVGKAHPQALVFPLTVAMKSNVAKRSHSAAQIMDNMRQHSARLVEQADLVSHELIRVAVLWHELWHEGLEEASRLYFGDRNVDGMFATLVPLHEMLDRGAETLREVSFAQAFGHDLSEARHFCNLYRQTGEEGDINQAWDLYYAVFKKITRQLPQLMTLDLKYVSPRLKDARNLDLAVPGSYKSGNPVVKIRSFDHILTVIPSKQRPRRMTLQGSDGKPYTNVLKGHEDIRQDERVMQLFGLVNTLLNNDSESYKRHLGIQGFPAIPLSQNSGLLGWVPNSDTLHNLIKEYRESRRILLNIEHRIMVQMAPDYDNLTLMQKVEVFGYAMDNTTGKDLYRVLWLKSKSSESWLERRTTYTRSLGVMSMVGYILGLGDRHPSNLMLDRNTGKIVHIDFGDCFEVAMHREKYPERVPFRLTRMLTFAMEVSNIEGSFRITCEAVMRVIRENKESLMAVLEAFIHDPLMNWRLTTRESPPRPHFQSERRDSIVRDLPGVPQNDAMPAHTPSTAPFNRHRRPSILDTLGGGVLDTQDSEAREVKNARAVQVLARVKEKLTGKDFKPSQNSNKNNSVNGINGVLNGPVSGAVLDRSSSTMVGADGGLSVSEQVDKLVQQATNVENLSQHYVGWCSFW